MRNAFAAGCLGFEPAYRDRFIREWNFVSGSDAFITSLPQVLLEIPGLTNLKISEDAEFVLRRGGADIKEKLASETVLRGLEFVPAPKKGTIHFSLHVPVEWKIGTQWNDIEAGEDFDVEMHLGDNASIVFVWPHDEDNEDPREAVILVREYIQDMLLTTSAALTLRTLGPTPFHTNFFLRTEGVWQNIERYNLGKFDIIKSVSFGHTRIALVNLENNPEVNVRNQIRFLNLLARELFHFYEVVTLRNARMKEAVKLQSEAFSIVEKLSSRSLFRPTGYFISFGKRAKNLRLKVMMFKLMTEQIQDQLEQREKFLYFNSRDGIITDSIYREQAKKFGPQYQNFNDVVHALDDRKRATLHLVGVFISALFGVIGGLLAGPLFE